MTCALNACVVFFPVYLKQKNIFAYWDSGVPIFWIIPFFLELNDKNNEVLRNRGTSQFLFWCLTLDAVMICPQLTAVK